MDERESIAEWTLEDEREAIRMRAPARARKRVVSSPCTFSPSLGQPLPLLKDQSAKTHNAPMPARDEIHLALERSRREFLRGIVRRAFLRADAGDI